MNKEVKERWLKALRSGEYEQGTGALRNKGDGYCCLGVLVDLAVQEGILAWAPSANSDIYCVVRNEGKKPQLYGLLPSEIVAWAHLPNENPEVIATRPDCDGDCYRHTLSGLNDGGRSFAEIADIIEEQL